jgi:hypothetical protein
MTVTAGKVEPVGVGGSPQILCEAIAANPLGFSDLGSVGVLGDTEDEVGVIHGAGLSSNSGGG